ncbi:hypothetical protein Tco_0452660 [Tanacetum coccineum]
MKVHSHLCHPQVKETSNYTRGSREENEHMKKMLYLIRESEQESEYTEEYQEDSEKGDAEISDVAKADAEKIEEIKDDAKKAKLPPTSSSLPVSLGFGDQFLKLSSDTSLVSTIKDTTDAEISLLDIKIQLEVPHIQSPSVLTVPVLVISKPSVLTPIPVTPSVAPATTLLAPSSVFTVPPVPPQTTAPIPTPPITTDAPTITTVVPKTDTPPLLSTYRHGLLTMKLHASNPEANHWLMGRGGQMEGSDYSEMETVWNGWLG